MSRTTSLPLLLLALSLVARGDGRSTEEPSIDFGREIRPLLSDNCFACHGPDEATRAADLRLDLEAEALRDRGLGIVLEQVDQHGHGEDRPARPEKAEDEADDDAADRFDHEEWGDRYRGSGCPHEAGVTVRLVSRR